MGGLNPSANGGFLGLSGAVCGFLQREGCKCVAWRLRAVECGGLPAALQDVCGGRRVRARQVLSGSCQVLVGFLSGLVGSLSGLVGFLLG